MHRLPVLTVRGDLQVIITGARSRLPDELDRYPMLSSKVRLHSACGALPECQLFAVSGSTAMPAQWAASVWWKPGTPACRPSPPPQGRGCFPIWPHLPILPRHFPQTATPCMLSSRPASHRTDSAYRRRNIPALPGISAKNSAAKENPRGRPMPSPRVLVAVDQRVQKAEITSGRSRTAGSSS